MTFFLHRPQSSLKPITFQTDESGVNDFTTLSADSLDHYSRLVTVVDFANLMSHQIQRSSRAKFHQLPAVQDVLHKLALEPD